MLTFENTSSAALDILQIILSGEFTPVFDLDGVAIDARHRQAVHVDGSLNLPEYIKNATPENIARDSPLPILYAMQILSKAGVDFHVCTARTLCKGTVNWLHRHGVFPKQVLGRKDGDTRKDFLLKKDLLLSHFKPQLSHVLLIDDNLDNCNMAHSIGCSSIRILFDGH